MDVMVLFADAQEHYHPIVFPSALVPFIITGVSVFDGKNGFLYYPHRP
jgi:hypothetical protein